MFPGGPQSPHGCCALFPTSEGWQIEVNHREKDFVEILQLVEFDRPEIQTVSFGVKRELLGIFEEAAVLMNSS